MFQSLKGRTIKPGQKVKVYFNLHLKKFSIKDQASGLVLGHSDAVYLEHCSLKVSEAGRQRVIREKKKNVHAYIIGSYAGDTPGDMPGSQAATYNPYKYSSFVDKETEKPLHTAARVNCIGKQLSYS